MKLVDLVQGSPEWHAWRRNGLGGSDIPNLMGLSPYADATPEALLGEKVQGTVREATYPMRRGVRLEPVAREWWCQRRKVRYRPVCVEHSEHPWIRASLDGLAFVPVGEGPDQRTVPEVLEVKAPNWEVHDAALAGLLRPDHMAQVQWQLLVTGAGVCWFVSVSEAERFRVDHQLCPVRVTANVQMQARIRAAALAFWQRVLDARRAVGVPGVAVASGSPGGVGNVAAA